MVAPRLAVPAPASNPEPDDTIHDEVEAGVAAAAAGRVAHADDDDDGAYSADEAHADTDEGVAGGCIIEESVEGFDADEKALPPGVNPALTQSSASPATSPSHGHQARKLRQRVRTVSFDSDNLSAREAALRNARGHSPDAAQSAHEIPAAAAAATSAAAASSATSASIAAAATPYSPSHLSFISASSPSHYRGAASSISPAFGAYGSSACSSPSASVLSRSSVSVSVSAAMRPPPHLALDTQFECSDEYIASMDPMALAMALASESDSNPPTVETRRRPSGSASRKHALRMQARYPHQLQQPQSHPPQQEQQQPPLFTRATRLDARMVVSDSDDDYSDNYSDSDREDGAGNGNAAAAAAPRPRRAPLPVAMPRASAPPPIPSAVASPSPSRSPAGTTPQASPALVPVVAGARPSPKHAHRRALVSPPSSSSKKQLASSPSLPTLGAKRSSDPASASLGGAQAGYDREPPHTPPNASSSFVTASTPTSHGGGGGGTAFPTLGRSSSTAVLSPSSNARTVLSPSRRTQSSVLPAAVTPAPQAAALRLRR